MIASGVRGAIRESVSRSSSGLTPMWPGEIPPTGARVGAVVPTQSARSATTFRSAEETMAEAPVVAPRRAGTHRARPRVMHPRPPAGADLGAVERRSGSERAVSEARRARNLERIGLVFELRCECARPNCRDTVPAVAEAHRGMADRFVIVPAHFNGGVVMRAADQFFVVDGRGHGIRQSRRRMQ